MMAQSPIGSLIGNSNTADEHSARTAATAATINEAAVMSTRKNMVWERNRPRTVDS
jgi:hypothetical protein